MDQGITEWDFVPEEGAKLTSVEKALLILQFIGQSRECTLSSIISFTGLPKSTAVRLIDTLLNMGFVRRTSHGQYAVAIKVWRIGASAVGYDDVRAHVLPVLQGLVESMGETAHYAVYEHGSAVYVEKIDGLHPIRSYTTVGGRSPAYATATGKALLAWCPREEIRRVGALAERHTESTIAGVDEVTAECDAIRRQGYSVNRGEWRDGVWGVASPVFGRGGQLVAAIGISGPRDRLETNLDQGADVVRAAAHELTKLNGG